MPPEATLRNPCLLRRENPPSPNAQYLYSGRRRPRRYSGRRRPTRSLPTLSTRNPTAKPKRVPLGQRGVGRRLGGKKPGGAVTGTGLEMAWLARAWRCLVAVARRQGKFTRGSVWFLAFLATGETVPEALNSGEVATNTALTAPILESHNTHTRYQEKEEKRHFGWDSHPNCGTLFTVRGLILAPFRRVM